MLGEKGTCTCKWAVSRILYICPESMMTQWIIFSFSLFPLQKANWTWYNNKDSNLFLGFALVVAESPLCDEAKCYSDFLFIPQKTRKENYWEGKKSTLFPENSYGKLYNVKCSIYHQNN